MKPIRKTKTTPIAIDRAKLLLLGGKSGASLSNRRMVGGKMINLRPPVPKR